MSESNPSGKCHNQVKVGNKERRCRQPSGKNMHCTECQKLLKAQADAVAKAKREAAEARRLAKEETPVRAG